MKDFVLVFCGFVTFVLGFGPLWASHWTMQVLGYCMLFGGLGLAISVVFRPCHVGDTSTGR